MKKTTINMSTAINANVQADKRKKFGDQQKMLECIRRIKDRDENALWDLNIAISSTDGRAKDELGFSCVWLKGAIKTTLSNLRISTGADLESAAINRLLEVVWNSVGTVQDEAKVGSWMYTVAVNAARETARQEKMISNYGSPWIVLESDLPVLDKELPSPLASVVDTGMTPEEEWNVKSTADYVRSEMKKRCSNNIYHAYHLGVELQYSTKEVAKILNISEDSAYKRVKEAKRHLKDIQMDMNA